MPSSTPPPSLDAQVRISTCEPPLSRGEGERLVQALAKLMVQFTREGRCQTWSAEVSCQGHALVMAWDGPPLSGCSHDKIHHLLLHHETILGPGSSLLTAPPLLVVVDGIPTTANRGVLRHWLNEGKITRETMIYEVRADNLRSWLESPVPLHRSSMAPLLSPGSTMAPA